MLIKLKLTIIVGLTVSSIYFTHQSTVSNEVNLIATESQPGILSFKDRNISV